ncbi:SDR family oxidoreductase [Argonema galeatum]|uniref:SDR family oxidoreductase n=1 Tax=Argonema galeatum TaxID=2942762 RepID=UPI0020123069|nr:SDR family oxidoreductase [Argonema galeatum]MCL1465071.1 SDR family oxidoreductase [Argonema galeatum A003/A1]
MAKTVLITGASQGSGKATALLFARNGYDVVLAARQPDRLETVAQEIQSLGRSALAISTDMGDFQQVQTLVNKALQTFGNIDILINNAGICLTAPMEKTSLSDWQKIMDTNFWGYVYAIQAILPHFLERNTGTIINVGSIGGKMPLPQMTAYCASKYAITGLTESLRLELFPKGIQVCAVHPGVINSNFMERAMFRGGDESETEARRQQMSKLLESSWVSKPEDIANAIWDAVQNKRSEVVVGPTFLATEAYRLFPGLMQWVMSQNVK